MTLAALLAALIGALLALSAPPRAAEEDKGVLADLISKALSTPATSVSIGAVDGVLSSDSSISDIVLSDRSGPWLKIDKVRLVWSRLALLKRRLEVDQLTIGHVQFLRRPLPSEAAPPPDATAPQSILPELPVKVIVKQFAVQELSLGEPVIGVAARLDIAGRATLGPPSEGLDLSLTSRRLDAPGEFSALLAYVPASDKLTRQCELGRAGRRPFCPFRQSSRSAAGKARLQRRRQARQFHREARLRGGRGRLGQGRGRRRPAGRRAAADPRPEFAARGHGARRHPPDFRRRHDAQGRRSVQRRFEHRAARRPASRFGQRPARLRGRQVGRRPARSQGPRRRDSGRNDNRKARSQRLDRRTPVRPKDRGRIRRRANPRRGRIDRPGLRDVPRRPERVADGRGDADSVRGPRSGQRSFSCRPGLEAGRRPRFDADVARRGFAERRSDLRRRRPRRVFPRARIFPVFSAPRKSAASSMSRRAI